jgi:hypothetical protein
MGSARGRMSCFESTNKAMSSTPTTTKKINKMGILIVSWELSDTLYEDLLTNCLDELKTDVMAHL